MILRILTKPPVLLVLALILAVGSGVYLYHSGEIGDSIGTGAGKMTGLAVGSYPCIYALNFCYKPIL